MEAIERPVMEQDVRGIGARRAAETLRIALRLAWDGLDVHPSDVEQVAADGLLAIVGIFRDRPLYDEAARLEPGAELAAGLREAIGRRRAWVASSRSTREAAAECGLRPGEFEAGARDAGLRPGLLGRWDAGAVAAFAAEGARLVRAARTLGWKQAAARLGVHERTVEHLVEAGLLSPASAEGPVRFTVAAVEQVAGRTDLDWTRARTKDSRSGAARAWRELAGPAVERDRLVADMVGRLQSEGVDAWARYSPAADRWTVDWPALGVGPALDDVAQLLPERLARAVTARRLILLGPVGQVMHWADMLRPGTACVVDCETTGLDISARVVEIAVVDAATGDRLLETLVQPGVPIPAQAQRIHKITDAMVASAPTWDLVLPRVQAAVGGRRVLAYNEEFDRRLIVTHSRAIGTDPAPPRDADTWGCLMRARSTWLGTTSHLRLGGGHRALGDAQAARALLPVLARRPEWTVSIQ